jgi:tetratricopeptide (TPR) repeat protein
MVRKLAIGVAFLCVTSLLYGRQAEQRMVQNREGQSNDRPATTASKVTPEQQKYAKQVLETAEADAGGLQGGMRGFVLLQIARSYAKSDKAKAVELLEQALTATRTMDDDGQRVRGQLQEQIVQTMVPLAPQRADELLLQVDPGSRAKVLQSLLAYYQRAKQTDRALEVIYRIGQEDEIPYRPAAQLMEQLPPERSNDFLQLFTTSLASYSAHKHTGVTLGAGDFAEMVTKFANSLPPTMVKDAITELLRQAENTGDGSPRQPEKISMSSAQGSVSMNSFYEWRLFQLLPVLKEVDPDEADRLLKKYQAVQSALNQYPQGTQSLAPSDGSKNKGGVSMMVGGPPPGLSGPQDANMQEMHRADRIAADAVEHPEQAMANAETISSKDMRASAYRSIARETLKKHPTTARAALKKLLELAPDQKPEMGMMSVSEVAQMYLETGDKDEARKAIEKGLKIAESAYKEDTNPDDPNKALKAYWPSTQSYIRLLRIAGQISPTWALTLIKDISDDEVRVAAETGLAAGWLDLPTGLTIMSSHNDGKNNTMMMSIENDEQ